MKIVAFTLLFYQATAIGFKQADEAEYLSKFGSLIADSYSALDDGYASLFNECKASSTSQTGVVLPERILTASSDLISTSEVAIQCPPESNLSCVIPAGMTLIMDGNLNVPALIIRGRLMWNDTTFDGDDQFLCAGYVAVEDNAEFLLDVAQKRAWIYIRDNGAKHPTLGTRVLGAAGGTHEMPGTATVKIKGKTLTRSWSLLSHPLLTGHTTLKVMHDPLLMGWQVGDRIVVAPTKPLSRGEAQSFKIAGFGSFNKIYLDKESIDDHLADFLSGKAIMSAEVINMTRNVVVTGDDFRHVSCDPTLPESSPGLNISTQGCHCSNYRNTCTVGLNTVHMHGGMSQIEFVRVEKCGQRGIEGKYCMHLHHLGSSPQSSFRGNAIEYSHNRGIIVHGTHLANVEDNVLNDVRGGNLYIEDGNEMYNNLKYNVAICPWAREDSNKWGCTIPGTSNHEADTSINQSGMFAISSVNNWIGNRMANHFNGMFIDPNTDGGQGRGPAKGNVCPASALYGRMQGNTFHSSGRFGTYTLNKNFPRNTDQSVENNGFMVNKSKCAGFLSDGSENGHSVALVDHFDYQNAFNGHYEAGDIQHNGHSSIDSDNLIYWKETKNFADGCSAHIKDGFYRSGRLALPDQGTIIIEDTVLDGNVMLEANHHCGVGHTGVLCMPQYVLHNTIQKDQGPNPWVMFQYENFQSHAKNQNHGGIFVLSPDNAVANAGLSPTVSTFFLPGGYSSLVSSRFNFLLNLGGGECTSAASLGSAIPGLSSADLDRRYAGGILCKPELRALKIYSRNLTVNNAPDIRVQIWSNSNFSGVPVTQAFVPYHQIGNDGTSKRQGYSFPVVPGHNFSYRISFGNGQAIPTDWIIEFSDTIIANRWGEEKLYLDVVGRDCGEFVSSLHDRRFIWSGSDSKDHLTEDSWGHGACSVHPNMPLRSCPSTLDNFLGATECPDACGIGCGANEYCECGTKTCQCEVGFAGENCEIDLCASARCSENGECSATYLGGVLPVSQNACVCSGSFSGPLCDKDPCTEKDCGSNGTCIPVGDSDSYCKCNPGFFGEQCNDSCSGFCQGSYPFGCATSIAGKVKYMCGSSGGCYYANSSSDPGPSGFCSYKLDVDNSCICETENDCMTVGQCLNGSCPPETPVPNGTPCNSSLNGQCVQGICISSPSPPTPSTPPPPTPPLNCGCNSCDQQTLNGVADGHSCGDRINWLKSPEGGNKPEYDACVIVGHDEFPEVCGGCDPLSCNDNPPTNNPTKGPTKTPSKSPTKSPTKPPTRFPTRSPTKAPTASPTSSPVTASSPCGCASCTSGVFASLAGDHSCGDRINWLKSPEGGNMTEHNACIIVGHDEYPEVCGGCDPLSCDNDSPTTGPTKAPTASPTSSPVTTPSLCGCASCTPGVLSTFAGDHSCGDRINWLKSPGGGNMTEHNACIVVGHDEYPEVCGGCDPLSCKN